MHTLSANTAVMLVRRNLDELDPNGSVMYTDESTDNASLDNTIKRLLPDAINAVHLAAPVAVLEGESVEASEISDTSCEDGVLTFGLNIGHLLRLVAFQAIDSDIVVTEVIPEASPEGRKQLNKYIRGRYDRPRLVRMQGVTTHVLGDYTPVFRYFSLQEGALPKIDDFEMGVYLLKNDIAAFSYYLGGPDVGGLEGTEQDCEIVTIGTTEFWHIPFDTPGYRGGTITIGGTEYAWGSLDESERTFTFFANGIEHYTFQDILDLLAVLFIKRFLIIKEQTYNETTPATEYPISGLLRSNIIDYLTALVMETYGDQRFQLFSQRAMAF